MSAKHPIISVTGSSGAGTTSVKQTFETIFRREHITAAFIEGDAFHRYDRAEMERAMAEAKKRGNSHFSHFGLEANLLEELEDVFANYGENGTGRTRHYVHDEREAELHGAPVGAFTPWADFPRNTDLLFYEGLHGASVTAKVNVAQHADLKIGVVPVINLEWIQKLTRDKSTRDRRDPDAHARLREIHLSAVHRDRHQLPAHPDGRHLEPVRRPLDPDARRVDGRDPLPRSARHRLPLPAVDDPDELHVARQLDRHPRRHARPSHATHPDAAHLDACGAAA
jgi:hypothetical protein